jgi:hypothetical protein
MPEKSWWPIGSGDIGPKCVIAPGSSRESMGPRALRCPQRAGPRLVDTTRPNLGGGRRVGYLSLSLLKEITHFGVYAGVGRSATILYQAGLACFSPLLGGPVFFSSLFPGCGVRRCLLRISALRSSAKFVS